MVCKPTRVKLVWKSAEAAQSVRVSGVPVTSPKAPGAPKAGPQSHHGTVFRAAGHRPRTALNCNRGCSRPSRPCSFGLNSLHSTLRSSSCGSLEDLEFLAYDLVKDCLRVHGRSLFKTMPPFISQSKDSCCELLLRPWHAPYTSSQHSLCHQAEQREQKSNALDLGASCRFCDSDICTHSGKWSGDLPAGVPQRAGKPQNTPVILDP